MRGIPRKSHGPYAVMLYAMAHTMVLTRGKGSLAVCGYGCTERDWIRNPLMSSQYVKESINEFLKESLLCDLK